MEDSYKELHEDLGKAFEIVNNSLNVNSDDAMRLTIRGVVYLMQGKIKESLADIDRSLKIKPNSPTILSIRGSIFLNMGRYEKALADLDKSLRIRPNDANTLNLRGLNHQMMKNFEESLTDLNKSIEICPFVATTWNYRGLTYQYMGDYEKSLIDLNMSLDIKPNDVVLNNRALTLLYMGRYNESLEDLNSSLKIGPNNAEALGLRALTLQYMSRIEESETMQINTMTSNNFAFEKLLKDLYKLVNPEFFVLNLRGNFLQDMGEYKKALEDLNKSLELVSNNAETLSLRGLTYQKMDKFEYSLNDLNESLNIKPDYGPALNIRGTTYLKMGKYKESKKDLKESIKIDPNDYTAFNNLGLTYQNLNKSDIYNVKALSNRGITYLLMGEYEKSLVDLNKALNFYPNEALKFDLNCATFLNNRGMTYFNMGKYEKARDDFKKSLEIRPDGIITKSNLGITYQSLGEYEDAINELNQALGIKSSDISIIKSENKKIKISREQNCIVALKSLKDEKDGDFLKEFKAFYECQLKRYDVKKYAIETYGITYDPNKKKYMMVFEYGDKGSLKDYISKNVLKWQERIEILCSISENLSHIHKQEICHRDLHSGNIIMKSVWDFKDLYINIYTFGNLIIAVPQVLDENTNKSNIEPKIIDLEFASGTPNCYKQLAEKCMHEDPSKRPTAEEVYKTLQEWKKRKGIFKEENEFNDLNDTCQFTTTLRQYTSSMTLEEYSSSKIVEDNDN
ncbi:hypothetical protein C2G38_2035316 [Gigaspora rosea]|uniref:Protein kinase domain-containing protein n=1 Tax=Gigaspora rosea TaxID=44941 RepID=A0A397VH72_9GLOM|nr:hypothetical protein C2G38_2035316 [Gigaspora rosea]